MEERNITGNTFIVLQDDDQKAILEEKLLLPITKIHKEEEKVIEGRGRGRIRKYLNKKRKSNGTQTKTTKNTPTKGPKPRRKN